MQFIFAAIICTIAFVSAWGVGLFTREVNSDIRKNKKDTKGIVGIFKALAGNDQLMWVACAYSFSVAGSNLALVLLAASIFGFPQQMVFLIVLMVITDSVEYGQLKLGHRDESLALSVRPLIDKFGGAVSNGVVSQIAIMAGMTTGATAASITAAGKMNFKWTSISTI